MNGYVHSTESFGTVDGPGVRFVIFLQGCPMRCRYCHNPDTWQPGVGTLRSPQSLIDEFRRNEAFYRKGGITVTGGEPLLQPDFLLELFSLAKKHGIHTCLDTSGVTFRPEPSPQREKLDALMALTDLVLLDLKQMDSARHEELTDHGNEHILAFARYLSKRQIPIWVRHVLVPGITDDPEQLRRLGCFIAELSSVKALDVLPYHTMGVSKYRELGLPYPLEGVPPATQEQAKAAREQILTAFRAARRAAR